MVAKEFFDIDELTVDALVGAADRLTQLRRPGQRLAILRDKANLDHVQIDDFTPVCQPDTSGPEFFLYDLSWNMFTVAESFLDELNGLTGSEVKDVACLRGAFAEVFEKYGPCAIAVKVQHAYRRTLRWQKRSDNDAQACLEKMLGGKDLTEAERLCLGDWSLARGVELAVEYNLPIKIHTGYCAGHSVMVVDRIKPGHLCDLLIAYPKARFVLMHGGYPYSDELIALAKHFPNVYMDLCWVWSMDPFSTAEAVRKVIHTVPSNKLLAFGGDTFWPTSSWAYATQARRWLTRALAAEVGDGLVSERQAMDLASRWMLSNHRQCFDIEATRHAIREADARTLRRQTKS